MPTDNLTGFYELGDLNSIQILPIKYFAVEMNPGSPEEEGLLIPFVEAGSSWKLTPVTLPDDSGGEETQGYNLELIIIFPNADYLNVERLIKYYQNNLDQVQQLLVGYSQNGDQVRSFYLSGFDYQNPLNSFPVMLKEVGITAPFSITHEIEPADMRNRQKLTIRKFFTHDQDYYNQI